jgi:hypothetical protein
MRTWPAGYSFNNRDRRSILSGRFDYVKPTLNRHPDSSDRPALMTFW